METKIDRKKLETCAECTCFNLRKASRVITQLFDNAIKPWGVRGTQFSILAVLSAYGPEAITILSKVLVMDRTTLTRNLKPMENAGLIKITRGNDLRSKTVSMTEKGQRTFAEAFPHWEKTQTLIVGKLGQNRFNSLIKDLSEITEIFSAKATG